MWRTIAGPSSGVLERGTPSSVYNVGAAEEHTNLEIVRAICRLVADEAGLDLGVLLKRLRFVPDRPGHDRRYALKTQRISDELGWSPLVPLEAGLRQTVRWYLDHQDWVERVVSGEYRTYYEAVYLHAWSQPSA